MTRNMAGWDRAARLVIGVLVLGLYGAVDPPWKYATLLGLIPIGTALTGNCPLYTLFGFRTNRAGPPPRP